MQKAKHLNSQIGDLHDGVIWLQLPEIADQSNRYLNPIGNTNWLIGKINWQKQKIKLLRFF